MKKLLAIMLIAAILLGCCACSGGNSSQNSSEISLPESESSTSNESSSTETFEECESAEEFANNMTFGWNLGLAMSYFAEKPKTTLDGWSGLVYIHGSDGSYNRSDTFAFDPTTKTANITWTLGTNGILQAAEGSYVSNIGVEQWNFSLSESDKMTFKMEELVYVTKDGKEVSCDADKLIEYETDMSGGTGGKGELIVFEEGALKISDVKEVRAKMKFISLNPRGAETPESVIEAQTRWGNPLTTQEMINEVRDKGFNLIRIQVSYVTHMDDEGNIDELWLDRVVEVVDYCMNAGVYCLLTSTGAGWLKADGATFVEQSAIYKRMWEQIAERFTGYDDKLLFEACNEVLNSAGQWWNPPKESYFVMNSLYQVFVDTVRASGGYNATRNLVLNPYAAAYDYNMNLNFKLPTDSAKGHLIAQVHCYEPNNFCFNETNLGHTNFTNEWGTDAEKAKIDSIMEGIKKRFIDELKIPVMIGEFGVVDRSSEEEREEYIGYYSKAASDRGIKLVIFDDGWEFTVFERTDLSWPYEKVIQALLTKGESVESLK